LPLAQKHASGQSFIQYFTQETCALNIHTKTVWALNIQPKIPKFRSGDKQYGNFLGKFPENPENVEFPKSDPFNDNSENSREKNITSCKKFPKISIYLAKLFTFHEILENAVSFATVLDVFENANRNFFSNEKPPIWLSQIDGWVKSSVENRRGLVMNEYSKKVTIYVT